MNLVRSESFFNGFAVRRLPLSATNSDLWQSDGLVDNEGNVIASRFYNHIPALFSWAPFVQRNEDNEPIALVVHGSRYSLENMCNAVDHWWRNGIINVHKRNALGDVIDALVNDKFYWDLRYHFPNYYIADFGPWLQSGNIRSFVEQFPCVDMIQEIPAINFNEWQFHDMDFDDAHDADTEVAGNPPDDWDASTIATIDTTSTWNSID